MTLYHLKSDVKMYFSYECREMKLKSSTLVSSIFLLEAEVGIVEYICTKAEGSQG